MAQLVKRTITEEYTVDEDIDGIDMDDEDEDLEDEAEEVAPSRRSKR